MRPHVNTISLLLSPSSLCSPQARPVNPRDEVLKQGRDFNWGASRLRRWQANTSKSPPYWGLDARFFYRSERERSNEELKSRGRIESERQQRSKVKGSSVLQNISKGMASLWKGCVNLFYSQVGRDKLSLQELNKGTLVYSQAEGQFFPGKPVSMIIIVKATKSKSKKQFAAWSQNWLSPCNTMTCAADGLCLDRPLLDQLADLSKAASVSFIQPLFILISGTLSNPQLNNDHRVLGISDISFAIAYCLDHYTHSTMGS